MLELSAPGRGGQASVLSQGRRGTSAAEAELADPALARALGNTRARLGGQRVALRVRSGDPSIHLVDASAGVDLLVIGAGGGRTLKHVLRHAH